MICSVSRETDLSRWRRFRDLKDIFSSLSFFLYGITFLDMQLDILYMKKK